MTYNIRINLRGIYKTPLVNAIAIDRNDLINAMRSQGLTECESKNGSIDQNFSGDIEGVKFNYCVAFELSKYSHLKGTFKKDDYQIESFDMVSFNAIPDIKLIAANIRNKGVDVDAFPTLSDVEQHLPKLEKGLKWELKRDINISSSGKLSLTWRLTIHDDASVNLAYRSVKSNAKSAITIVSRLEVGSMIETANETIRKRILTRTLVAQSADLREAFKDLNNHKTVGNVDYHSTHAHVTLNNVRVEQIPALLEFLDRL